MLAPTTLKRGELTRIIIEAVVAAETITAAELAATLNEQGIPVTRRLMAIRLAFLAKAGRIDRLHRGVYTGV